MRYMPRRTLCALSASSVLCLAGCTGPFASATPTVTPGPTATVTIDYPQLIPKITCSDAIQLIQRLQVNKVEIYVDDQGTVVDIEVYTVDASDASATPDSLSSGDHAVDPLTNTCKPQILSTVEQANKQLPTNAQIQVEQHTIPG